MCMTKKDFKAIANILADVRNQTDSCFPQPELDQVTVMLNDYFEEAYPRYDSQKFLTKSGYFNGSNE